MEGMWKEDWMNIYYQQFGTLYFISIPLWFLAIGRGTYGMVLSCVFVGVHVCNNLLVNTISQKGNLEGSHSCGDPHWVEDPYFWLMSKSFGVTRVKNIKNFTISISQRGKLWWISYWARGCPILSRRSSEEAHFS